MGEARSVAHLPVGSVIVNNLEDYVRMRLWEAAVITAEREVICIAGNIDKYWHPDIGFDWDDLAPVWTFAVVEGEPGYDLFHALIAAIHHQVGDVHNLSGIDHGIYYEMFAPLLDEIERVLEIGKHALGREA